MATREEIADILAGFTLFGDLQTPQLLGVASIFDEVVFPTGERILRQGLTGSGFYVILDGTADVRIDGQQRATLGRGDFFGEVSILLGEPPTADVVAIDRAALHPDRRPERRGLPRRPPPGHVPDAPGTGPSTPQRQPLAELTVAADPRPFPPGEYPVIVIGSGPGGLQVSYGLKHYGVQHAVLSADPSPGGMFRRWPFFQRLLSWTKPYAPEALTSREYQRYDWNSLIAFEPELRSLQAEFMDGSSYFPSRPGDGGQPHQRSPTRPGSPSATTAAGSAPGATTAPTARRSRSRRRTASTAAGSSCWRSASRSRGAQARRASSTRATTRETREASTYAGKRLFIIGKQNSGFELASGLVVLGVEDHGRRRRRPPRPRSRRSRWSASGPATCSRSRTTSSASGSRSSTPRSTSIEHVGDGFRVKLKRTDNGEPMSVDADEVIAATGFTCPLQDLTELGVTTFGQAKLPSVTPLWESATVPGIFFAGTDQLGLAGPQEARHPVVLRARCRGTGTTAWSSPGTSRRAGSASSIDRPPVAPPTCVPYLLREATCAPELWHQKAYLARVLSVSADDGIRDEGILPVVHALDAMTEDVIAMTVEADGTGSLYPSSTSGARAASRSTRCPATRCSTSRRARTSTRSRPRSAGSCRGRCATRLTRPRRSAPLSAD